MNINNQTFNKTAIFSCIMINSSVIAAEQSFYTNPDQLAATAQQCVTESISPSVPGAGIAIALGDQIVHVAGYGVKNIHTQEPVNQDTLFRTGSTQKMMTAAAILQQSETGQLNLDDALSDWAPELTLRGRWTADDITLRHLLQHNSGLPNAGEVHCGGDEHTLSEWAADLSGTRLYAKPGKL